MADAKKKIIVLGAGFAGVRLATDLDQRYYDITIVSPRNYFVFTPLLASTTVGTIEFRSIIEPVRAMRKGITFHHAAALQTDLKAHTLECRQMASDELIKLSYDYLIIAVGAVSNTFGIPGVKENSLFLKDLSDARAIRQRLLDNLERASRPDIPPEEQERLLNVVVVGAGPTGIEFAAELYDFISEDLPRWFPQIAGKVGITVIEAQSEILSSFSESLREYTRKRFARQNIKIRTREAVTAVEKDRVMLAGGSYVPCGLTVWSAGIASTPFVSNLPVEKDSHGRIYIDSLLRVPGHENIYAVGDCGNVKGQNFPSTAQLAEQQGKYLSRALNRAARGKEVKPFSFYNLGMLAYVGGGRALADLPGVKGHGFLTWLFWRSVYLTKVMSLKNRILVVVDWFKTAVFGRDISRF